MHDDDVLGGHHPSPELRQDAGESVPRICAPYRLRSNVARAAENVVRLLQAELANVAGDRRLRHLTTRPQQRRQQLVLGADAAARDDARDQSLPLVLAERPPLAAHSEKNKYSGALSYVCRGCLRGTLAPSAAETDVE